MKTLKLSGKMITVPFEKEQQRDEREAEVTVPTTGERLGSIYMPADAGFERELAVMLSNGKRGIYVLQGVYE